jgi:hypothetical protein
LLEGTLAVAGTVPSALYGVAGMMDIEFPYLGEKIKLLAKELKYNSLSAYRGLKPAEHNDQLRTAYYQKQKIELIAQARANWKDIVLATKNLTLDDLKDKTPLQFLFSKKAKVIPQSNADYYARLAGKVMAGNIVAAFSLPFGLNSLHTLEKYIPNAIISWMITCFLGAATIYGNVKITFHFFEALIDLVKAKFNGESFDSLPLQMRFKTTVVAGIMCLISASLSYTIANLLTTKDYDGPAKDELRMSAMIGVCLYHFNGLLHLYYLSFRRFTSDEREIALYAVEDALANFEKLLLSDYIKEIENPQSDIAKVIQAPKFEAPAEIERDIEKAEKTSWLSSWFCFNRHKKSVPRSDLSEKLLTEDDQAALAFQV